MSERNLPERIEAFAAKVDKRSHDECWEWKASKKGHMRYGQFKAGNGRSTMAHRYAWEAFFGPVPDGMLVLHKCNNPSCVNPYHLYLGSQADNMKDAVRAKTHVGFQKRKLNDEEVEKVLKLLALGERQRDIAKLFGVCQYVIFSIGKGIPSYVGKKSR